MHLITDLPPHLQATEGTPIFVHQGEQQGPMLVLTPHAKLGRRIRCTLALHVTPSSTD